MPARAIATVSQSNIPLICLIDNPSKGLTITEAALQDSTGTDTELAVAADGQSFQVPVNTVGSFVVGVTVNKVPSPAVNIAEGTQGGTLLLAIYRPAPNVKPNGFFILEVN
jgi:hypothetical protein